ncbi:MAG: hypothetical protein IJW03_00995 [Clostridia bacterium]|nr:hypothetical protein [Clostridia bacterium]
MAPEQAARAIFYRLGRTQAQRYRRTAFLSLEGRFLRNFEWYRGRLPFVSDFLGRRFFVFKRIFIKRGNKNGKEYEN